MTINQARLISLVLLVLLAGISMGVGVMDLSWSSPSGEGLFALSRFPRTAAAILAGGSLAVGGVILQTLVHNRFVEPMTTGTGEGAALGILLALVLLPEESLMLRLLFASVTALVANLGFLAMVRRLPPTQPLMVPLVGIVYGGILGAIVTFFAYQYDLLQYLGVWLNGDFSGILKGRYELLWLAGALALLTYFIADRLAIVGLGDTISTGLGVSYHQVVMVGLVAISVVSAMTVVTVGMIPFIGLVVPNVISRTLGDNLRRTLPVTALFGANLVLACDIVARLIRFPYEMPVGSVLGLLGALVFLWILYHPRKRHA
ncbi:iron chelate uptake ABC transporter family permease subunit [uncultured Cohaesibacter sp.]|uniref:ABC transporter permease n=1 Tax=uncultured Cohaesibacter sp. TaxID=1002546 RepID=UPI0029C8F201|nr:iron chelate uptake ABC transporter family permease subunit [uncultured Cohaesibacter sp.]